MTQQFHLILETSKQENRATDNCRPDPLPVPAGQSDLRLLPDQSASLSAPGEDGHPPQWLIEPVLNRDRQPRLLVVSPEGTALRVNGRIAPSCFLLKERDTLALAANSTCHLALFNQPRIGPAGTEFSGRACVICLGALEATARCYVCGCGAVLHHDAPASSAGSAERLQCSRVASECPNCQRPIVLTAGYSRLPDFCHED